MGKIQGGMVKMTKFLIESIKENYEDDFEYWDCVFWDDETDKTERITVQKNKNDYLKTK
jgi:hypothetical protein